MEEQLVGESKNERGKRRKAQKKVGMRKKESKTRKRAKENDR